MIFFRLLAGALLAIALSGAEAAAQLKIDSPHVNVGASVVFSTIEHRFRISNTGDKPVALQRWYSPSGFGEVVDMPSTLAPSESAEFVVRLPLDGEQGSFARRFAIFTDEPGVDRYRFSVSGFSYSLIEPEQPVLNFQAVARGKSETLSVDLTAREQESLQFVDVIDQPEWTRTRIEGNRVEVTVNEKLPAGPHGGKIRLRTNLAHQSTAEVQVVALGLGGLEASEYFMLFPPTSEDTVNRSLRFTHPDEDVFSGLKMQAEAAWTMQKLPCAEPSPHCVEVRLQREIDFQGQHAGSLNFSVGPDESMRIGYSMIRLAPGQQIREVGAVADQPAARPAPALTEALSEINRGSRGDDVSSAPVAPKQAPAPVAPVNGSGPGPVRLVWRARAMDQTYGFLVYRATSRRGPFVRVSAPVVADPEGKFSFVDERVDVGSTYYYYVDSLAKNGRKERFSPLMSKKITAN